MPAPPPTGLLPRFLHHLGELPRRVIVPDRDKWLYLWDVFIVIILFGTAIYEPLAIATLPRDPTWAVWANGFLDTTFVVDMALQFSIAYAIPMEGATGSSLWETDLRKIRARYCGFPLAEGGAAGGFWIDLLAVFPGVLQAANRMFHFVDWGRAKSLELLRVLRLVRLTKLWRLKKYIQDWHAQYGFPFYLVELARFFLITSLTCHWLACVWIIVEGRVTTGKVSFKTDRESWLSAMIKAKGDTCYPDSTRNPVCVYNIAFYWGMMTLTTVGYGDIVPQNQTEYVVCTICMLIVAYIWAFIMAKIVTLLDNLDPHEAKFLQRADDLQTMMSNRSLPRSLQERLRNFMHASKSTWKQHLHRVLLDQCISQGLQREIAKHSGAFEDFRKGVWWARDLQQDALLDLMRALTPASYGPNEVMTLSSAIIIMRGGLAALGGQILRRGDVWGHIDILLDTPALIGKVMPRTMTNVDIVYLMRSSLVKVCKAFPHADRRLRRAQIRSAAFRAFILEAKARGRARKLGLGHTIIVPRGESAVTSFVSPGENRLQVAALTRPVRSQVELIDIKRMLEGLMDRQEALEERVENMCRIIEEQNMNMLTKEIMLHDKTLMAEQKSEETLPATIDLKSWGGASRLRSMVYR